MNLLLPSCGMKRASEHWFFARDGNPDARSLFDRHYSRRHYRNRQPKLFVGPGQKLVLINGDASALFVWRLFRCDIQPPQTGVNCAVFRNESAVRSSNLIRQATAVAWQRWPHSRLWTLVDSRRIRSTNPGCCFLKAGWSRVGTAKHGKIILAISPGAQLA